MKSKNLVLSLFCFMVIFCVLSPNVIANGRPRFEGLKVQNSIGGMVSVEVDSSMLQGDNFVVGGWMYTEWQWVDFFVRNLLVGKNADNVTRVVLRKSTPKKMCHKLFLLCPPALSSAGKFYARVSRLGNKLTIICSDISATFCDKWYLNESGLALFGR